MNGEESQGLRGRVLTGKEEGELVGLQEIVFHLHYKLRCHF